MSVVVNTNKNVILLLLLLPKNWHVFLGVQNKQQRGDYWAKSKQDRSIVLAACQIICLLFLQKQQQKKSFYVHCDPSSCKTAKRFLLQVLQTKMWNQCTSVQWTAISRFNISQSLQSICPYVFKSKQAIWRVSGEAEREKEQEGTRGKGNKAMYFQVKRTDFKT